MANKLKKKEVGKLIFLPKETVKKINKLAEENRTKTKPYIEKVIIDHAENPIFKTIKL